MSSDTKRYSLVLPQELYDEVEAIADRQHSSVVEIIRRFIRLGLIANEISKRDNSKLIIREDGVDREILLV